MERTNNQNKTILVVEDDTSLLEAVSLKCSQAGYSVLTCSEGEKALEYAFKKHPDLIVLDVLMPKMDGITVLDKLRADPWGMEIPVIILSNLDPTDDILAKISQDKPSFYLLKASTSLDTLLEKISELLFTQTGTEAE